MTLLLVGVNHRTAPIEVRERLSVAGGAQMEQTLAGLRARAGLDSLLSQLFDQTMRVAKKVRTDTGIGEHAVSVPFAAVELAKKIFGELQGLQILLLGAGEMGELTAEHLGKFGLKQIFV